MGKIFYIMGKSAVGKDHIASLLLENQDLNLKKIIPYTTRPIRDMEEPGKEYYFVDEGVLREFRRNGKLIESRSYQTVHGVWTYFTADDGQIRLSEGNYLAIGTLESFGKMKKYFGSDAVIPLYIQVETGERLTRALNREKEPQNQRYAEMCRRFLADESDFSEENILSAGIWKRFENRVLEDCVEEISSYIRSVSRGSS